MTLPRHLLSRIFGLTSLALVTAAVINPSPGVAGDDGKIASSAICDGWSDRGRSLLRFDGSSLLADGADVTVICPIIRDAMTGRLKDVNIRLKRPSGTNNRVSGQIFSCDSTFGGCFSKTGQTGTQNEFTSIFITAPTGNAWRGSDKYYYFRFILPDRWKIVSVGWTETE